MSFRMATTSRAVAIASAYLCFRVWNWIFSISSSASLSAAAAQAPAAQEPDVVSREAGVATMGCFASIFFNRRPSVARAPSRPLEVFLMLVELAMIIQH